MPHPSPAEEVAEEVPWSRDRLAGDPHADAEKAVRVQAMFAAIAPRYDLNNRLHSLWQDQRWRRRAVREAAIEATSEVLDVACGTGDLSAALAAAGARRVVGVDFSEPMLEIARGKSRSSRAATRCEYRFGDAMALDFEDASFDVVTIAFGLRNVAEPARALREFRRVLRPGGRLVVLEFSEPRWALLRALNRLYTERIMPLTATLIAGDRSGAYRYLPRSVRTFPSAEALSQMIAACGFADLRRIPCSLGICTIHRGVAGADRSATDGVDGP
jgi:demethylmenaquinone methyltransferase/2-methoxy-6-polyprenyl-1,4-benzoquinol methylase